MAGLLGSQIIIIFKKKRKKQEGKKQERSTVVANESRDAFIYFYNRASYVTLVINT